MTTRQKEQVKLEELNEISRKHQEALDNLVKLEERLKLLREFTDKAHQLQETRRKLKNTIVSTDNINSNMRKKPNGKKVVIVEPRVYVPLARTKSSTSRTGSTSSRTEFSLVRTESKQSILLIQRSKPLQELLTKLQTWHAEVKDKMHTIETLKAKKKNISALEEEYEKFDREIKELENEKEDMDEKFLFFVLRNVTDSNQEYVELAAHLEDENRAMEDRVDMLLQQIDCLKEINTALFLENEYLRHKSIPKTSSSMSLADDKYRKSIIAGKTSAIFPDSLLIGSDSIASISSLRKTPSIVIEEREDRLSLDRESIDSFKLDQRLENWKMDEQTIQEKVKRIGNDLHEMKVNSMKLNMIKKYVQRHGFKTINRDTLIDPLKGMSQWQRQ